MARRLAAILADRRRYKGFTQKEVAQFVGMTRENYSAMENGRRKEPLSPEQSSRLSKLLEVPMLTLLEAMGYAIAVEGIENEEEAALLDVYRRLSPAEQRMLRAAAGLPSSPSSHQASAQALRRIVGRQELQEGEA